MAADGLTPVFLIGAGIATCSGGPLATPGNVL